MDKKELMKAIGASEKEVDAFFTMVDLMKELDEKESVPILLTMIDMVADKKNKKNYELVLELLPLMKLGNDIMDAIVAKADEEE